MASITFQSEIPQTHPRDMLSTNSLDQTPLLETRKFARNGLDGSNYAPSISGYGVRIQPRLAIQSITDVVYAVSVFTLLVLGLAFWMVRPNIHY